MAQTVGELLIKLGADVGDIRSKLETVSGSLKNVESASERTASGFSRFQATVVTLNQALELGKTAFRAVSAVIGEVADVLGDTVAAANEQENATFKLNAALKAAGQFTNAYSRDLHALAEEFLGFTTFGNEAVLEVERLLVSFGAAPDQIKPATQAVLDLAAGLGTDLQSAAQLVGKAIAGEFGTLSRYGILVDANATHTEKLDQALAQIQTRFGGQAAAAAKTFEGQLKQLSETFSDLQKEVGFTITNSDALRAAITAARSSIDGMAGDVRDGRDAFTAIVDDGVEFLVDALVNAIPVFVTAAEVIETLGRVAAFPVIAMVDQRKALEVLAGVTDLYATRLEGLIPKALEFRDTFRETLQELRSARDVTEEAGEAVETLGTHTSTAADAEKKFTEILTAFRGPAEGAAESTGKLGKATKEAAEDAKEAASAFEQVLAQQKAAAAARDAEVAEGQAALSETAKAGRDIIEQRKKEREEAEKGTAALKEQERVLDSLEQATKDIADSMERAFSTSLLGAAGENVKVMGDLATSAEIAAMQAQFLSEVMSALNERDFPALRQQLAAGNAFLDNFADGILLTSGRAVQFGSTLGAVGIILNKVSDDIGKATLGLTGMKAAFQAVTAAASDTASAVASVSSTTGAGFVDLTPTSSRTSSGDIEGGTIFWSVKATGSPTLPISEYFGSYLPRVFEDLERKAPGLDLAVGHDLAVGGGSGGGSGLIDEIRELRREVRADVAANRAGAASSYRTAQSLSSGRAGATLAGAVETMERRTRGTRGER